MERTRSLIPVIVNLPDISGSEHAIIAEGMRLLQGQRILVKKMNGDPDYHYFQPEESGFMWCEEWLQFQ